MESSYSNVNSMQTMSTSHYIYLLTTLVHSQMAFRSGDEMSGVSN